MKTVTFAVIASIAAAADAMAEEAKGPAAGAISHWYRSDPAIECVGPTTGKVERCGPGHSEMLSADYSPDGRHALAFATWVTDPTGNAVGAAVALFERDGDAWRKARDLKTVGTPEERKGRWTASAVGFDMAVMKPGDSRCCATGRKSYTVALPGTAVAPAPDAKPGITKASTAVEPHGWPWTHNGSAVAVDQDAGVIAYNKPRAGLAGVVQPGSVLFRGRLGYSGQGASGTAYAFKEGCDPAPYAVRGGYDRSNEILTLVGAGPIRQGCEVVGYSMTSPHSRLVFKNVIQD